MNFEKFLHDNPRNFNHRRMSYVFEEDDDGDLELTESDAEKIVNTLIPKIIATLRENINFNAKTVDDVADTLDEVLEKIRHADLDQIDPELKKYRDLEVDNVIDIHELSKSIYRWISHEYYPKDLKRSYEKSLGISKDIMPDDVVIKIAICEIYTDLQKFLNKYSKNLIDDLELEIWDYNNDKNNK